MTKHEDYALNHLVKKGSAFWIAETRCQYFCAHRLAPNIMLYLN